MTAGAEAGRQPTVEQGTKAVLMTEDALHDQRMLRRASMCWRS